MHRASEPYVLRIASVRDVDGRTFPVYVMDGTGDQRMKVTIVSVSTRTEHVLHVPETAVSILASAAKCDVTSDSFKEFLVGHICLRKDERTTKDTFVLGQTRFVERPFDATHLLVSDVAETMPRRMVADLSEVLRQLSDQRCFQERQIWSNQQLFDAIVNGFEQLHLLATHCMQQEAVVAKLVKDVDKWKAAAIERTRRTDSALHEHQRTLDQLESFAMSTQQTIRTLDSQIHDHSTAMTAMRQDLESAWKMRQQTMELEAERSRKEWSDFRMDNKRHMERIKDAFSLLNEAQSRTSKHVTNVAGEVSELGRFKEHVAHNGQLLAEVRQAYVELLPKVHDMYVLERKRQAIAAVQTLSHVDAPQSKEDMLVHFLH
ncbi:hypothetical protein, variant 1 [Aphanomyces invadans]|uniref:Uncharacterized protein n=1 Tax=Aphanomyces invadans TaxID=157072 RepID=A0A024TS37_9STRA|nr:hypothetical protein, variant 1 [Aphanomyces invadans]ETV96945.1 hypothetical protein, variant 1 [Aphanomyces invadans]|eukprot:XP_008874192.1 hypothetical protein, variant 1 [Aphanomyces invadans]